MKKNYNLTSSHHKDGQEKSRKIYRSISDHVKRLDDARGCANKITDLFTPSMQIQRSKLQEFCERLIFNDPQAYGLKAEELLWRKAYYDVISTAKRLKKPEYTIEEKSSLIAHINAGIGHYHHYVSRLQTEYDLSLEASIDFFILDVRIEKNDVAELKEWAISSVHRSLIYLGDLSRYKLDIYPNWDPNLSIRYYSQALVLKPQYGMPHNQMGTLASSLNQHLDATYHYIQCLMCKHSFEGTENNLSRLFEKNSQFIEQLPVENPDADCIIQLEPTEHIKRFVARFLLLTDVWFFNKKIPHIYDLCHQTNLDLQECLSYLKPIPSESSGSQNGDSIDSDSIISPAYLSTDMVFKIIVICLLCITKLQNDKNANQLSNVVAFTLAIYSQLIQHISTHVQEGILNFPLPENLINSKNKKKIQRRRKKLTQGSDEESDASDVELSDTGSETDSIPEILDVHSSSDEEDTVEPKDVNSPKEPEAIDEIIVKSKLLHPKDIVDIVSDEIYFDSIKILSDWLKSDVDVLKSCGKSTRSLFQQVANLLNLIDINTKKLKLESTKIVSDSEKIPLPEDLILKDLELLKGSQDGLIWKYFGHSGLSKKDEALARMLKLIAFGHFLGKHPETGMVYDTKDRLFTIKPVTEEEQNDFPTTIDDMEAADADVNNAKTTHKHDREIKGQLMGQLWLAEEVKDLESRVKGKMSLSPYLVVDVEALIKYMYMVKQLVHSRKFIVLVPSAVLSALDDLKKVKLEAREAIRWLEAQFNRGNRFFRAQRTQERLPLPLIKYPKKKDKESLIYIQIIECCHYLAEQQKRATNLVTLLMGDSNALHNTENREISYVGLAQSAGVNLELITEFYAKWKKAAKGKR